MECKSMVESWNVQVDYRGLWCLLLLVCEVALGDSMVCDAILPTAAEDCRSVGKHSARARGKLSPDPAGLAADPVDPTGRVKVPLGDIRLDDSKQLSFNEYIVYDESQVRLRYLLRCAY